MSATLREKTAFSESKPDVSECERNNVMAPFERHSRRSTTVRALTSSLLLWTGAALTIAVAVPEKSALGQAGGPVKTYCTQHGWVDGSSCPWYHGSTKKKKRTSHTPVTYGVVALVNETDSEVTYSIRAYRGGGWTKQTVQPGRGRFHWYRPASDFQVSFSSGDTTKTYNLDANVIRGRTPTYEDGRKYYFWKGARGLDLYSRSQGAVRQASAQRARKAEQELLDRVSFDSDRVSSNRFLDELLRGADIVQAATTTDRQQREQEATNARERGRMAMQEGNWSEAIHWFQTALFEMEDKATRDLLAEAEEELRQEQERREREQQELRERQRREGEAAEAHQQGRDAMAARDWARAIRCFQKALGYLPDDKTAQNLLAKAQQELNDEQKRRELEQREHEFKAAVYGLRNTIAPSPSGGPVMPPLDATMMAQVRSTTVPFSEPDEPFRLSEEEWANLKRKLARHAGYLDPQEDALLVWLLRHERGPNGYNIPREEWEELLSTEYLEELLTSTKIGNVNKKVEQQRARIERFRELGRKRGDRRAVVLLNNEELQVRITQQFEIKLIEAREARSRDWAEEMDKLRAKLKSYETLTTRERDDPQFAAEIKAAASRVWERYLQREREARAWVERENAKYPWREKERRQDPQENLDKQAKIRDARIKWAFAASKALEARQAQADCEALEAYESFVDRNKLQNKEAPLAIQVKTDKNARTLVIDYLIPIRSRLWEDEKKIEEQYREKLNREIQEISRGTGTPGVY